MASYKSCHGNSGDDEPEKTSTMVVNNDDLITEVLLRLPVKSLLRFESVCKGWLSLISNSRFTHNHSLRNPLSVSGLFFHKNSFPINSKYDFISLDEKATTAPFKFLTFVDDPAGIKIQQSCNGLLCCYSFRMSGCKQTYYIYNPTTNQYTTLPQPGGRTLFYVNLAFDPLKSSHYKAVCVRRSDVCAEESYQMEIYSSETGLWRLSGEPFSASNDLLFRYGVFWNGALHWISPTGTSLCFDVDQEYLRTMPMPQIPQGWDARNCMYFGESQGHMHLIEIYGPHTTQFDILEMESDYSRWFVKYCVNLDSLTSTYPEMVRNQFDPLDLECNALSILCVVPGEDEAESILVLHVPGKVVSYNLKDSTFKKLHDLSRGLTNIEGQWSDVFQFIEILSCV